MPLWIEPGIERFDGSDSLFCKYPVHYSLYRPEIADPFLSLPVKRVLFGSDACKDTLKGIQDFNDREQESLVHIRILLLRFSPGELDFSNAPQQSFDVRLQYLSYIGIVAERVGNRRQRLFVDSKDVF